jgi:hypothetical protein
MKNLPRLLVVFAAVAGTALVAQDNAPAPTVTSAPPPPPPTSAPVQTPVDGLIYVQKLPSAAQLTADAEAEGMTVTRMEQLADRTIVTYRYASGNSRTFAYTTTLPEDPDTVIGTAPAAPHVSTAPAPSYTVVYSEPAPVYYYPRYYDPYWPRSSVSIGLGFGRSFGNYGYGYHGSPRYYGNHRHYSPSHGSHHWRR